MWLTDFMLLFFFLFHYIDANSLKQSYKESQPLYQVGFSMKREDYVLAIL